MTMEQSKKKDSYTAWLIVISAALFFFIDFVQLGMPNTLRFHFLEIFPGINIDNIGLAFSLGNFLFVFPAGILLDRYPIRRTMLLSLSTSVISAYGVALSKNFSSILFFRFFSGATHAFCFLCCTALVSHWFSPNKRGFPMGIVIAIGLSGLLFAQRPLALLAELFSWKNALIINATLGLIVLIIAFCVVEDYPINSNLKQIKQEPALSFHRLEEALANEYTWKYAVFIALLNSPLSIYFLYLNHFLMTAHCLSQYHAQLVSTSFFLGNLLGGPIISIIADNWYSRKQIMIKGSIGALILFIWPIISSSIISFGTLFLLFFLLGILISVQVVGYPAIIEANSPSIASSAMSLTSFVVMGSLPLFQKITNILLNSFEKQLKNNPSIYLIILAPIIVALISAILLAFYIDEKIYPTKIEE